MATYVSTLSFTDQGTKGIKESRHRADSFRSVAEAHGAKVRDIFWTLGPFDGAIIFEAPDDETATALMLHLASLGNVSTRTARAFDSQEMGRILDKISA